MSQKLLSDKVYSTARIGRMTNPAIKRGLRPQLSAVRPTKSAMGNMTICAAMMQADIIAVASFGNAAASFCPTSGKSGALAKWNNMTHRPKITSGRVSNRML